MKKYKVVIDTNVVVSAMKSKKGASFKLISMLKSTEKFINHISVPLLFEYEYSLKKFPYIDEDIEVFLGYLALNSKKIEIYYLWRPYLSDPKDDCILEAALNSGSNYIITYNKRDFQDVNIYGISVLNPKEFLEMLGEL